jgi:hypothetical protein
VRPAEGRTNVTIELRRRGTRRWRRLKSDRTNARGAWSNRTRTRRGARYRVRWGRHVGPPTRAYRAR